MKIKEKIIELRKEGYYAKEISEILQIDYRKVVLEEEKRIIEQGLLTEEDINEGKKKRRRRKLESNPLAMKVFELKKQGFTDNAIARMLTIEIAQTTVSKYVREGISLGIIDEDEISIARIELKKLEKEQNPDRKRVLEGLRRGELDTEIAKDTIVGDIQVGNIRKSLVKEGLITQEEIDEARQKKMEEQRRRDEDSKKEEDKIIDKEKLLSYLILGYDTIDVKKKMGKPSKETYEQAMNQLIEEKRITLEEIREYRNKKEMKDKEIVFQELKRGMVQREIAKIIKTSVSRTQTYIEKVKKEKNISDEDILRWKNEKESSAEKRKNAVLDGLKKGLTSKEIVNQYPKQKLTVPNVKNIIRLLIEEGIITKGKIQEYRQKRIEENKRKNEGKLNQFEKEMLNYLKNGYEKKEILDLSGKSKDYINMVIRKLKEKGKITEEEIEQARIRRKEEEEKAEQKKAIQEMEQQSNRLKREIDSEIRFGKKPSQEKLEKMREYINLCQERYQKENITRPELLYLGQVLQKVEIKERDLLQFVRLAISIGEYQEALNFVRLVQEEQTRNFSESRRQKVKKLEEVLSKANKVQQALQTIKKGNTNTEVLSNVTGLSKDEINVLKIRITRKPIRIAGPIKRRKILDVLITDKDPAKIQKELEINDFEMDDMKEQMFEYKQQKKKYKKATSEQEKQEIQEQIEKNTRTRVVVLYTKIGKKPEFIAKVLKKQPEEIQEDLAYAIEKGIILEEQLQGIDPLNYCSNLREQAIL